MKFRLDVDLSDAHGRAINLAQEHLARYVVMHEDEKAEFSQRIRERAIEEELREWIRKQLEWGVNPWIREVATQLSTRRHTAGLLPVVVEIDVVEPDA